MGAPLPFFAAFLLLASGTPSCCAAAVSSHEAATRQPELCAGSGAAPVALPFCRSSCCDAAQDEALAALSYALASAIPNSSTTLEAVVMATLCAACSSPRSPDELLTTAAGTALSLALPWLLPAVPSSTSARPLQPAGRSICVEKIIDDTAGSFVSFTPHPADGTAGDFLSAQDGKIWQATLSKPGSGAALRAFDLFLDLSDRVYYDATRGIGGLVSLALHPGYTANGGIFVSYYAAFCGSNHSGCHYQLVVAEFAKVSSAGRAEFTRIIFSMELPDEPLTYHINQQAGQILFGPCASAARSCLYLIAGHGGGSRGDGSKNCSSSFCGAIIRFDVSSAQPKPEIVATNVNRPMGCSFDARSPSHLYCADEDKEQYQQVLVVVVSNEQQAAGNMSAASILIAIPQPDGSRAAYLIGGLVYRGSMVSTLNGRYVYWMCGGSTTSAAWSFRVDDERSFHYSDATIHDIRCSRKTAFPCRGIDGHVRSMATDGSGAIIFVTTTGIYRLVESSLCGATHSSSGPKNNVWIWIIVATLFVAICFAYYTIMKCCASESEGCCNNCCNGSFKCCND